MFNKIFKKLDEIKDEVIDQAGSKVGELGKNLTSGVGDSINEKKTDLFSSILGKVTDTVSSSAQYLAQVEKMANEKRAQELGITSRELVGLSLEEVAAKYGMSVKEYQKKVEEDAKQYNDQVSLAESVTTLKERASIELKERESQAGLLNLSLEEFDNLTLQEQADRLNISLNSLLDQRALKF